MTMLAYAATKAGVEAFGRALRVELTDQDVRVGVAYFGLIDTGMVPLTDRLLPRNRNINTIIRQAAMPATILENSETPS
ncbi:SDR family NAD(P)-dependent oxidoreductase [Mycolicibacterium sp.]|uniref:SDR family NAD(P)-dependent oxidoreductase n=1 Tax=Mycolicibacterium sp. TaxID=2320850 RepID=UPI0037CA6647